MVFSSLVFLCVFLPVVLLFYYLVPSRWRNGVALCASLFFYSWGAPRFLFVLVGSSLVDFVASRWLSPTGSSTQRVRKLVLALAVTTNLSVFLYCKYMNFLVDQFNALLGVLGQESVTWAEIILPIGISFFTFQKLSYLIDVYRGTAEPAPSLVHYVLYVSLFPQLIAGPIVRYHDVAKQLVSRTYHSERFLEGVWRFCVGLGKKVLLANVMGQVADKAFGCAPGVLPVSTAWLGAVCYAFQIYYDFSGYSDMAIGLGKMLGLEFLENFNFPYIAQSFTEFWRRWHISLSNWMREYLYIPLGGNRVPAWRTYLNLWIVFLLSGFWHGASWNFVVWGAYHGLFLSGEKFISARFKRTLPAAIRIPRTFLLVLIGWVFFRAETLPGALSYLGAMMGRVAAPDADVLPRAIMNGQSWTVLAVALLFSILPLISRHEMLKDWQMTGCDRRHHGLVVWRFALSCLLLTASLMSLITGQFNPFIYFRF